MQTEKTLNLLLSKLHFLFLFMKTCVHLARGFYLLTFLRENESFLVFDCSDLQSFVFFENNNFGTFCILSAARKIVDVFCNVTVLIVTIT